MIVTLEPKHAAELHSPPPVPRHEVARAEAESTVPNKSEPGGVLAFTGAPLAEESRYGFAAIIAGVVTVWAAKGERA